MGRTMDVVSKFLICFDDLWIPREYMHEVRHTSIRMDCLNFLCVDRNCLLSLSV
jgi:hypothetical protein